MKESWHRLSIRITPSSAVWMQVVEILNSVDRGTEKHIMETLEIEEPELADEIRKKMFVFEDILLLDDRSIQRVLRDVDNSNDLSVLRLRALMRKCRMLSSRICPSVLLP